MVGYTTVWRVLHGTQAQGPYGAFSGIGRRLIDAHGYGGTRQRAVCKPWTVDADGLADYRVGCETAATLHRYFQGFWAPLMDEGYVIKAFLLPKNKVWRLRDVYRQALWDPRDVLDESKPFGYRQLLPWTRTRKPILTLAEAIKTDIPF